MLLLEDGEYPDRVWRICPHMCQRQTYREAVQMGLVMRKKGLRTCAKCAYSDDPAHAQSIIRAL